MKTVVSRTALANIIFNTFKELMSALYRPITGNEHRWSDTIFALRPDVSQCVKFYSSLLVALRTCHTATGFNGQRNIHESTDGHSNDSNTRPDDVGSYCECFNRIESLPACPCYHAHTSDHANGGPHICEQMASICFECYGVSLAPRRVAAGPRPKVYQ